MEKPTANSCPAWLGISSLVCAAAWPLPQHSIGPAPLPPAPSSCRSGAEQYSHRWEGAKSCGSFVRVQRDVGFRGDLLESHSAAANFSMSFVLPFSGYPAFVHLHLRRFFLAQSYDCKPWAASAPSLRGCHCYRWGVMKGVKPAAASFYP